MFTMEQLQGVLLTTGRPEVTKYRSQSKTGWTVRTRVMFRAKWPFLIALQRKFEQFEIHSILRESEGVNRDGPVLIVGRHASISKLRELMPKHIPCSHANWNLFDSILDYMESKLHLTQDGMEEMIGLIENEKHNKKV